MTAETGIVINLKKVYRLYRAEATDGSAVAGAQSHWAMDMIIQGSSIRGRLTAGQRRHCACPQTRSTARRCGRARTATAVPSMCSRRSAETCRRCASQHLLPHRLRPENPQIRRALANSCHRALPGQQKPRNPPPLRISLNRPGPQTARVDIRRSAIAVGSSERGGAGTVLLERARAGDHPAKAESIRSIDGEDAVISGVAGDRATRSAVAELQGAGTDGGPPGIGVGTCEDRRAGVQQRCRARAACHRGRAP